MNYSEAKGYLDNATRNFVEAQSLCYDCSLRIQEQTRELAPWPTIVNKITFITECLMKQGLFLYDNVLKYGIEEQLIKKDWSDDTMTHLTDQMRLWQGRIDNMIIQLQNTKNILVEEEGKDCCLADYITQENVHLLRDKIEEIPRIEKQIKSIRTQYEELSRKVKDKLLEVRLKDLQTLVKDTFSLSDPELITLLESYPNELFAAENDLGSILLSLTKHFDRCKMIVARTNKSHDKNLEITSQLSENDYLELCKIVKKDNEELSSVVNTIYEIIGDVDVVLEKCNKLLMKKELVRISIKTKINKLLTDLKKYDEYLSIFKDISQLISKFKQSCDNDMKTVQELFEFYLQFQTSYNNLLNEAQRRHQMSERVDSILKECERNLKTLEFEDLTKRQEFLEVNGNYLPGNIWPNEIDDFTPLYTLNYSVKKL